MGREHIPAVRVSGLYCGKEEKKLSEKQRCVFGGSHPGAQSYQPQAVPTPRHYGIHHGLPTLPALGSSAFSLFLAIRSDFAGRGASLGLIHLLMPALRI